ncbi:TetR/AcrR family transcriptional regulator [Actinoplanes sp. CA-131856]
MRADAARNLETVLTTGARMLAADPAASVSAIAAEAGVDRRTVYRRFATREDLLQAIYVARLDAIERAMTAARLTESPVPVALHRYVEGIIEVNRTWPVDLARMLVDPEIRERRQRSVEALDAFLRRAADEGHLRTDLPARWTSRLLHQMLQLAAVELPGSSAAEAADTLVETFLHGAGRKA